MAHDHASHDHSSHASDPRRVAMSVSLAVAFVMLAGKLVAYRLTGSTAILSDAAESVIHLAATAIAAASLWYSAQPADQQHPYGHGRIAYFSAGLEGGLISFAALVILYEAAQAFLRGPELRELGAGLAITAGLAAINLVLGLYLVRTGRKRNSLVLIANGQHVLTDMWTSVGVLVGVGAVWATGLLWLDPVIAAAVGVNILWTAWRLMRRGYDGLMDRADPKTTRLLSEGLARAVDAGTIAGFHQLRHRRVNEDVWVEVHLLIADEVSVAHAHAAATQVEEELRGLLPIRMFITTHIEPIEHDAAHPEGHREAPDALAGS